MTLFPYFNNDFKCDWICEKNIYDINSCCHQLILKWWFENWDYNWLLLRYIFVIKIYDPKIKCIMYVWLYVCVHDLLLNILNHVKWNKRENEALIFVVIQV